jgi:hypothetical protein
MSSTSRIDSTDTVFLFIRDTGTLAISFCMMAILSSISDKLLIHGGMLLCRKANDVSISDIVGEGGDGEGQRKCGYVEVGEWWSEAAEEDRIGSGPPGGQRPARSEGRAGGDTKETVGCGRDGLYSTEW